MKLQEKTVWLTTTDKMMELFASHPNMLKRINHLSSLME
jgi:Zn-dependent protease with chaperone function